MLDWKFPNIELDEKWFKKHGIAADAAQAARQWREWLDSSPSRRDSTKLHKALELAVVVSRAAVDHYLSRERWYKLSDATLQALDTVAEALGYEPRRDKPKAASFLPTRSALPKRGALRIALLVNLAQLNSPRFRMEVIRSIIREGGRHNFSVALHELPPTEPEMSETVGQIVRNVQPHGIVWFQLTPSAKALLQSAAVPSVIVHGVKREYPAPVIGHILPLQDSIRQLMVLWARGLPQRQSIRHVKGKNTGRKVAVAHMPEEALSEGGVSIRNERIELIITGLREAGFEPHEVVVEDYSASNAWQVIEQCPDADGYVCLSDEIAISVKHLLWARGEKAAHRILGFDDSSLAARHNVSSISQHISDIGRKVCELLENCFRTGEAVFQEVTFELNLTPRTEPDPPKSPPNSCGPPASAYQAQTTRGGAPRPRMAATLALRGRAAGSGQIRSVKRAIRRRLCRLRSKIGSRGLAGRFVRRSGSAVQCR
jgi:DNA-binding LacI/PurR family transcriptional regulator